MSIDESSARTVCGDSMPAEWMTHHDEARAGDQMVRGDMSLFPAQVTGPEVLLTAVGSAMAMGQRKIHEL